MKIPENASTDIGTRTGRMTIACMVILDDSRRSVVQTSHYGLRRNPLVMSRACLALQRDVEKIVSENTSLVGDDAECPRLKLWSEKNAGP